MRLTTSKQRDGASHQWFLRVVPDPLVSYGSGFGLTQVIDH